MKYIVEITGEGSQNFGKILDALKNSLRGGAFTSISVRDQDSIGPKRAIAEHWFDGDGNCRLDYTTE